MMLKSHYIRQMICATTATLTMLCALRRSQMDRALQSTDYPMLQSGNYGTSAWHILVNVLWNSSINMPMVFLP